MIPHTALLATLIPGITGIIIYVTRKHVKKGIGWLATASAVLSVFFLLSLAPEVIMRYQSGEGPLTFIYPWVPQVNVNFGFLIDVVSLPLGLIVAMVSTLSCLYSIKYMKGEPGQAGYYANLLLFMTGMIGVFLSANLIQFYLFWEIMLIPSYFLITFWGSSGKRLSIGFKYFIFTHVGAVAMLLGILMIYTYTGTFNLLELPTKASAIPPDMTGIIFILLLIGFFVKMAVFPVHTWLPDAHSEAPTPISAMLSGVMVKCGAYGIVRILLPTFGQTVMATSSYLMILGVITIVYGGLTALAQTDIKRLLAYSSISQMGYIVFGIGCSNTLGIMGGLLHIINHALCKSLLFMCAGVIMHQTGTRDIKKMGGLIDKIPVTGIACIIGALSLVGVPMLNSFWSEWMILGGGAFSGKILITIMGVGSTVITAGYYLWFIWRVFFGETPKDLEKVKKAPLLLRIPLIILAASCVILGVLPGLALTFIAPAAELLSSFL